MIDQKKRTYHFENSSLLPLKLVLTEAEKESPSRPPKEQKDVNEELALKLMASLRKKYRKVHVVARRVIFPTKQSPINREIASLTPFTRNDMRLEP